MNHDISRRTVLQAAVGGAALSSAAMPTAAAAAQGLPAEGPDTPKICLEVGGGGLSAGHVDEAGARRVKQLGVNHVLSGGPRIPWEESQLRSVMDTLKAGGLALGNLMIAGFPNTIYGRPGRDEEIDKVQQSIRAAGGAGLPVIEYNFYAHRAIEGYYEEIGRGGAGLTAFDYARVKDLPPLPREGAHNLDEMWRNITYFLKAVIPVAEKAGVRLALHPNDPPAPISRGSEQIMGTVEGWKHLIEIVKSPSNGIT
ncbi:MAG: mannonate dehydratase, partial [Pseudomonadota bacterium]